MFLNKLNEVLASKRSFISDRLNLGLNAAALLINIIHWIVLFLKIKPTEPSIVLHYNVIYGADLVDRAAFIYMIPASALLILILNYLVANFLSRREKLTGYFLGFASIAIQVVFLLATFSLIIVNER